jgi:opacity protein-like surface antigen
MKKMVYGVIMAMVLALVAGNVWARDGYYVNMTGAMTFTSSTDAGWPASVIDYDDGYGIYGAFGNEVGNWRFEGELGYHQEDFENYSGDMSLTTMMVNTYYTLPVNSTWGVYAMGGAGIAKVDMSDGAMNDNSNAFAFQFGLGLDYAMTENWSLDAGWRYFTTAEVDVADTSIDYTTNMALVGVRYTF